MSRQEINSCLEQKFRTRESVNNAIRLFEQSIVCFFLMNAVKIFSPGARFPKDPGLLGALRVTILVSS